MAFAQKVGAFEANSPNGSVFAFRPMFFALGPTPIDLCRPALIFALVFHNLKLPYSISSSLRPVLVNMLLVEWGDVIDALALYSLDCRMAFVFEGLGGGPAKNFFKNPHC